VFLPPYSPDLNPIEYIWKSVKRVISDRFVKNLDDMRKIIARSFIECSMRLTFARSWMTKFLGGGLVLIVRFATIIASTRLLLLEK